MRETLKGFAVEHDDLSSATIMGSLSLDSLDKIEVIMECEDEFELKRVPDEDVARLYGPETSFDDFLDCMTAVVNGKPYDLSGKPPAEMKIAEHD